MKNNVGKMIKQAGLSSEKVAIMCGYSGKSAIEKIKSGKAKMTTKSMEIIASAVGCYPSELLPDEWQKPGDINPDVLRKAIEDVFADADESRKTDDPLNDKQIINLIVTAYKRYIKDLIEDKK